MLAFGYFLKHFANGLLDKLYNGSYKNDAGFFFELILFRLKLI